MKNYDIKKWIMSILMLLDFQIVFSQSKLENEIQQSNFLKKINVEKIDPYFKRDIFAKYKDLFSLHYFSKTGCDDSVLYFIKKGYYINNQTQRKDTLTGDFKNDMSPLMYATEAGFLSTCKLLLAFGADPYQKNSSEQSSIDIAIKKKNSSLIRLLMGKEPILTNKESELQVYVQNTLKAYENGEFIVSNAYANYALNLMNLYCTKNSFEYKTIFMILSETYQKIGDFAKAEANLNTYLNFCEVNLGYNNKEYYDGIIKLVYLYNKIGHFNKSKVLLDGLKKKLANDNDIYTKTLLCDAYANYYSEIKDVENAEKWFDEALYLKRKLYGLVSYEYGLTILELFKNYNQKPITLEFEDDDIELNTTFNKINNSKFALRRLKNFLTSKVLGRFELTTLNEIKEVIRKKDGEFSKNYLNMLLLLNYGYDEVFTNEPPEDNRNQILRIQLSLNNHPSTYQRGLVFFPLEQDLITQNNKSIYTNKIHYYEQVKTNIEKTYGVNNSTYLLAIDSLLVLFHNFDRVKFKEILYIKEKIIAKFETTQSILTAIEDISLNNFSEVQKENENFKKFLLHWANKNNLATELLCNYYIKNKLKILNDYRKYVKKIIGNTNIYLKEYNNFLKENKINPIDNNTLGKEYIKIQLVLESIFSKIPGATVEGRERDSLQINEFSWTMIRDILKHNEVAIDFFTVNNSNSNSDELDNDYYAIIIKHKSTEPVIRFLFNEKKIQASFKSLKLKKMSDNSYRGKPMKTFIEPLTTYQLFWKPIEGDFQGIDSTTIYYSPVGLLNSISFHTFKKNNGEYLSKSITFRYLSTLLSIFDSVEPLELTESNKITVISNPNTKLSTLGTLERRIVYNFAKLQKTETQILTETEASITNFKKIGSKQISPTILHIITHGEYILNNKNKYYNSILYLDTTYDAIDNYNCDGFLTPAIVSQCNFINTKLVVLSACESSLGNINGDEGVFGFPRAFREAGAEYILASIWSIPDKETSIFMKYFYDNLNVKKTILEAFENTIKTMREKKYPEEAWGGFILIR